MRWWILVFVALAACGGPTEPIVPSSGGEDDDETVATGTPGPRSGGDPNAPSVQAEVGALDGAAVDEVTGRVRSKAEGCFEQANAKLPFPVIHGDLELTIRIRSDGTVRWVFPSKDELGHQGITDCIAALLQAESWPKPEGGEEGIARASYGRGPEGRAPVPWGASDLGGAGQSLATELRSCKQRHGAERISVTLYVDADGRVMSAGAAVDAGQAADAVTCAVRAARGKTFPSPGSFPAKVSLEG